MYQSFYLDVALYVLFENANCAMHSSSVSLLLNVPIEVCVPY